MAIGFDLQQAGGEFGTFPLRYKTHLNTLKPRRVIVYTDILRPPKTMTDQRRKTRESKVYTTQTARDVACVINISSNDFGFFKLVSVLKLTVKYFRACHGTP